MDDGLGPLVANDEMYRKDASGRLVLSGGRPILITTDPLAQVKLTNKYRGAHVKKEYQDYYPSLNGIYNISEKLIARAAFARTLGRPDYGSIVPGVTVPDPASTSTTITIKNTALEPWTANSYDLALEYYFEATGLLSVGVFRKDFSNFFGTRTTPATPELLSQYDLDQDLYRDYLISTSLNAGSGRVSGLSLNYKQALTFLPHWARGVQVFGNLTTLRLEGSNQADFSSFIPRTANWGVTFARPKYTLKVNYNFTSGRPPTLLSGTGVPPGTYSYPGSSIYVDTEFEYRIFKRFTVFLAVRNASDVIGSTERYSSTTPEYARYYNRTQYGRLFVAGIKGQF